MRNARPLGYISEYRRDDASDVTTPDYRRDDAADASLHEEAMRDISAAAFSASAAEMSKCRRAAADSATI